MEFSHFLEHVLVRATVESTGIMRFQADYKTQSHETCDYHTIYSFRTQNDAEFDDAIKFFAFLATQVQIQDKHIEFEKKVISLEINEWFNEDTALLFLVENLERKFDIQGKSRPEKFLTRLRSIKPEDVQSFYKRWYTIENMTLIVLGGNCELESVCKKVDDSFIAESVISESVEKDSSESDYSLHKIQKPDIMSGGILMFKCKRFPLETVDDLIHSWDSSVSVSAFNERMKRKYGDKIEAHVIDKGPFNLYIFTCDASGDAEKSLYQLLTEVRRLQEFPFSEMENEKFSREILNQIENSARSFNRDAGFRTETLKSKLVNHLVYGDIVIDPAFELEVARVWHSRLKMGKLSFKNVPSFMVTNNLKLKESNIYNIYAKSLAAQLKGWGSIREVARPSFHFEKGNNGQILSKCLHDPINVIEWTLANGLIVSFQHSELHDKCYLSGFAIGGLSEAPDECILSYKFAHRIADCMNGRKFQNIGGKTLFLQSKIELYRRSFEIPFEISEVEVALQLVNLLFVTKVPILKSTKASKLRADLKSSIVSGKVAQIFECARGNLSVHKAPKSEEVQHVDIAGTCHFYNSCFHDASQFKIVIVGNLGVEYVEDLVKKYLGSIPKMTASFPFPGDLFKIRNTPMEFPLEPLRLEIPIKSRSSQAYICVPWRLGEDTLDKDKIFVDYLRLMMEQRLMHHLRIELGQVYDVDSLIRFDDDYFAPSGNQTFFMGFRFNFFESGNKWELVEEALTSLERFRENGPSEYDLKVLVRDCYQTNEILSEKLVDAYLSPVYQHNGDLTEAYRVREDLSREACTSDTESWSTEIQRLMPDNFLERNVIAVLSST